MSLMLLIFYRDGRPLYGNGFCGQATLKNFWWPLAERLSLPTLQRLEILHITELTEAQQLVAELRLVEKGFRSPDQLGEPEWAPYILATLDRLLPVLDATLAEWEQVDHISL